VLKKILHPLTDFVTETEISSPEIITYYYQGICPQTGTTLKLPRTVLAEKVAVSLSQKLTRSGWQIEKGKMLGVLIVENQEGKLGVIKAFSGCFAGEKELTGWVKQIPGYSVIAMAEKLTLQKLDELKQQLIDLQKLPIREEYQQLKEKFAQEKQELRAIHRQRKQSRDLQRQQLPDNLTEIELTETIHQLQQESRRDDWERRKFHHEWKEKLQPLEVGITKADQQIQQLKQERKEVSRQLQAQMQTAYTLTNFAGDSLSIGKLMGRTFIPTGTGDCSAPKLLHHCATNKLKPLAMAEVWWGETSPNGDKVAETFYPACEERCQPLMGFLLSGLPTPSKIDRHFSIPIIYEDDCLLAVNKPCGLLSVSGRGSDNFDSVVSRFRQIATAKSNIHLKAIHRLDQDTSGILLLAKNEQIYKNIAQQFEQRQVQKVYEAIVNGIVEQPEGIIDLPLWGNPQARPRQEVNYEQGKPSVSNYRVLAREGKTTRLEFMPVTGRTHQLRVHALVGLGFALKGDRLYGNRSNNDDRLYLHAREIFFTHPLSQKIIHLQTQTPF
jgi:tRNA pseudouridine32 synthase/23S rRNA pseudouridine746 synthase